MAVNVTKYLHNIKVLRQYSTLPAEVPVIKIPTYVKKHVEKVAARREERRMAVLKKIVYRGDTSFPVISCTDKEYNFYLGQVYKETLPIPLFSKYWMKMSSAGQKFTIMPWDVNPSLPVKIEIPPELVALSYEDSMSNVVSEFHQLNLSKPILEGLTALGYNQPTPIQAHAIQRIQSNDHVLCVAESGSGKTMAYMIPIMENLMHCKDKQKRYPNTPLALVVTPGRELAEQIALSTYQLSQACGVSVKLTIAGGTKHRFLSPNNYEPFDILVSTFGTIYKLVEKRAMNLSHIKHLVLDEADTLLDDSFSRQMNKFLSRIMTRDTLYDDKMKQFGAQVIFASTTIPRNAYSLFDNFQSEGPLKLAASPYIHRVRPHVQQKFVRVNNANRLGHVLELIKKNFEKKQPVMIFTNQSPACDFLSHCLRENDVDHVKFHAGLSFPEREEAFNRFQSGDVDVMCCTDLASRGLDTQRVMHVINFDFPNSVSDYIMRTGRVGRVGSNQGHVTSLVVAKSGVYCVQNIEMAVRKSEQLSNVDADIKNKIRNMYYRF